MFLDYKVFPHRVGHIAPLLQYVTSYNTLIISLIYLDPLVGVSGCVQQCNLVLIKNILNPIGTVVGAGTRLLHYV
ncbi:hypothetical protein COCCADRAFT_113912 [Bipolaris zeicola 26-R-13]|uniref:Uncharacterized protein n=1 Tax=Cochliobolus carbonum (strain 26-R-13) TaxID=930089 RepID=W6XHQ6_COCC2|nr:uncharacterized protein COCCADRAFT_113912 [Bipolaris zeicola 26-R-13]EUC26602.1 hypothetical protein COCCADRAFT_113912 [Bipolaris zeicola 26-R-13]